VAFFENAMQQEVQQRLRQEHDLAQALAAGQLRMYAQTQTCTDGHSIGAELLMRWCHPQLGLVPPDQFIALAEDTGLILEMGAWALREGCQALCQLRQAGCLHSLSINVSPRQFHQSGFAAQVRQVLDETGAPASQLILEVTEGLLIDDLNDAVACMSELAALGVRFSIDDFGTGYSNLAYLQRLPLYELKIDQRFVKNAPENTGDAAIAQLIISMSKNLGLHVVAEGVETQAQADLLVACGCDVMQGYLFARPQPLAQWLQATCTPVLCS
jgi:EAL domain-containing protein (putative c-di-GMP-specific phosphodiesterase class I)